MNHREWYFLTLAKEKNITAAANKLFISQQSLSKHIQLLEEQYHTTLCVRKPVFMLTPAGECLARNLGQIAVAETNMKMELSNYDEKERTKITFGINQMYFTTLCVDFMPLFYKKFPQIFLEISNDNEVLFEQYCNQGHLDLFLGSNQCDSSSIRTEPLINAVEFACVSNDLLVEHFGDEAPRIIEDQYKNGFNTQIMNKIPFMIQNNDQQAGRKRIIEYLTRKNTEYTLISSAAGVSSRAILAAQNYGAFFTTILGVYFIKDYLADKYASKLHFFPIIDYPQIRLWVGWNNTRYFSKEERFFLELLKDACQQKWMRMINDFPVTKSKLSV